MGPPRCAEARERGALDTYSSIANGREGVIVRSCAVCRADRMEAGSESRGSALSTGLYLAARIQDLASNSPYPIFRHVYVHASLCVARINSNNRTSTPHWHLLPMSSTLRCYYKGPAKSLQHLPKSLQPFLFGINDSGASRIPAPQYFFLRDCIYPLRLIY